MIELKAGDYRLVIDPERGGSVNRFDWRGEALMRPTCGPSILDTGSFPLVPFSNRIGGGDFTAKDGQKVHIEPNMPEGNHPHPLHGFGWITAWKVVSANENEAVIEHIYEGGEWPWPYRATQTFTLAPDGLTSTLSVENLGQTPMPAGLGFHPYFPRTADAVYHGLHRGEWHNAPDCLPVNLEEKQKPSDWWEGAPVGTRAVDTVYTGRQGDLQINWPSRKIGIVIEPTDDMPFTIVYSPEGKDFFCVEPVTHMTDAVNSNRPDSGLEWLAPSASKSVRMIIRAREI